MASVNYETANERFKRGFGNWFYYGITAAAVVHFALLAFFPSLTSADYSINNEELRAIDLPDDIKIPPPPEQIARPATPVISTANIDENITIAPTTFEHNTIDNLAPPPSSGKSSDIAAAPTFTPMTVRPELKNSSEVQRVPIRQYPPLLRDAGIGGTAVVWFFIDEQGNVLKTTLSKTSGYPALDEAAMQVANVMKFTPAKNRDKIVQVWVEIPILFTAK